MISLPTKNKTIADKIIKYYEQLDKRKKYVQGEPIKTLDELLAEKLVYFFGTVKSIEIIKSLQLRIVLMWLNENIFFKVINKNKKGE